MPHTPPIKESRIEDKSKLIAKFMGVHEEGIFVATDFYGNKIFSKDYQYHTSWDLLHGAWDKFKALKLSEVDEGFNDTYSRHLMAVSTALHAYPISVAFERLVRAIQWYNQQQK